MNKKWLFFYVLFVFLLFGLGIYFVKTSKSQIKLPTFYNAPTRTPLSTQPIASVSAEMAVVKRVIDGDTIELTDGRKVRYIGVDTPELHHPIKKVQCFGKEAMEENAKLVEGKKIKMVKDVSEVDKYKRLLRYIYVDGIFVNEYMAKEGYARPATFPPDVKYAELFREVAEEARIKNKGLWNKCK
jgi:micrococcal nuclease